MKDKQIIKLKKKKINFETIFIRSISIIAILISVGICCLNFCITAYFDVPHNQYSENITYRFDNIFINLLLLPLAFGVLYFIINLCKKIKVSKLLYIVLTIIFIFGIYYVNCVKAPARADSWFIGDIAREFNEGDFSQLSPGSYLYMHPLQLGVIYYTQLIFKFFNTSNILAFQNFNALITILCFFILFKITNYIFKNEKINKIICFLMLGFIVLPFYNILVYGNFPGLLFALIAILYTLKYLDTHNLKNLIILVLSISISIALKSNYLVYLIGILITLFFDLFKNFKKKTIIGMAFCLIIYFSSQPLFVAYIENISGRNLDDGVPMIGYIYMGLHERGDNTRRSGWYLNTDNVEDIYLKHNMDTEKTAEYEFNYLKNRLVQMICSPIDTIKFFGDKIASMWAEPSLQSIWTAEPAEKYKETEDYISDKKLLISFFDGKLNKVVIKYLDIYEMLIFTSSLFYICTNFKKIDRKIFILILIFFGGFTFHMIWEAKSVYVIPFYILFLPIAAAGLNEIFEKINLKLKGQKNG